MDFSILFTAIDNRLQKYTGEAPDFFSDLNLDQMVDTITAGRQEYNLKQFFYDPLHNIGDIMYRQEIMRDLENDILLQNINSFASKMRNMRQYLGLVDKLYYKYNKEGCFLEAMGAYCEAVTALQRDLILTDLKSRGLLAFRKYLKDYTNSSGFTALAAKIDKLKTDLSAVNYCLLIKGNAIKVRKYDSEIDYTPVVEQTFHKFKQGAVKDYLVKLPGGLGMNHVEAGILDLVAQLYPDLFMQLDNFFTQNSNYFDETIVVFDREIQFYISYLEYMNVFQRAGLEFCYPQISDKSKEIFDYEGFDLALAHKLIAEKASVVCNDFHLRDKERILVISGPNQGGKTTFARTFGQLHYLASLGFPVPGSEAQLFLFDNLFTHFEREENINDFHGKLQDDLIRIYQILNQATSNSIIIMNEIFTSTTLKDAIYLSKEIMNKIMDLDLLCVCVTFIDELASLNEKTVSMTSMIVPDNPALRTYGIVRRPADGIAYAISIAEKYHLTYDFIKERIN